MTEPERKSTLLNCISGIVRPARGTIVDDGTEITRARPDAIVRRGIVQCPEGRHVFPEFTVDENLQAGRYARGDEAARERRRQLAGTLDEPSLGLAPLLVERIFEAIAALRGDGVTIALVEQNAAAALALADAATVLVNGSIRFSGPTAGADLEKVLHAAYLGAA